MRLGLFESCKIEGECCSHVFFVGCPVWCLSWCPTSLTKKTWQYVAIATGTLSDSSSHGPSESLGLLQIWDCSNVNLKASKPELSLAIAHNFGKIYELTWCPMGTWDEPSNVKSLDELPRLGLLAMACQDGSIRIYSIPHPQYLSEDKCEGPFYNASPIVVLSPTSVSIICTAMCWSSSHPCRTIAGGYDDGLISLFYVNDTSISKTFHPYSTFRAHGAYISAISFAPYEDGRWIVTSGFDRHIRLWDTLKLDVPLFTEKGIAYKLHCVPGWKGFFALFERGMGESAVYYIVRDEKQKLLITHHNVPGRVFGFSMKTRMIAQADIAGQVTVAPVHKHLNHSLRSGTRIAIFSTELLKLESSAFNSTQNGKVPMSEKEDGIRKFGLVFKDAYVDRSSSQFERKLSSPVKMDNMPIASYDITAINAMAWNPNFDYEDYLLTAGQSGLCRLLHLPNLDS